MAKGNRSNSKRNTEAISIANEQYTKELEIYRRSAEARRNRRTIKQEFVLSMAQAIQGYIEEQAHKHKPLTMAGAMIALGIGKDVFYRIKNGEYDYITEEYRALHADSITADDYGIEYAVNEDGELVPLILLSDALEKMVILPIEEQIQENCMTNKGNPAGSIFLSKAIFGYKEEQEPREVTQNLIIADSERARDIIQLLNG